MWLPRQRQGLLIYQILRVLSWTLKVKLKIEKINPRLEVIFFNDYYLKKTGEEITAVRFLLDSKGNVMDLNQLQKAIISGGLK